MTNNRVVRTAEATSSRVTGSRLVAGGGKSGWEPIVKRRAEIYCKAFRGVNEFYKTGASSHFMLRMRRGGYVQVRVRDGSVKGSHFSPAACSH